MGSCCGAFSLHSRDFAFLPPGKALRRKGDCPAGAGRLSFKDPYMLETPVTQRGHDLFELDSSAPGKAGYLLRILQEHRLPESYVLQLYQQPFFFLLGAGMSGILNGILQRTDPLAWWTVQR